MRAPGPRRQHKAQAVERAFPRPRDEAVVSKADGRGRAALTALSYRLSPPPRALRPQPLVAE